MFNYLNLFSQRTVEPQRVVQPSLFDQDQQNPLLGRKVAALQSQAGGAPGGRVHCRQGDTGGGHLHQECRTQSVHDGRRESQVRVL